MSELRTELSEGVPSYRMDTLVPKAELEQRAKHVEEATSAAHEALFLGFHEGDPRVVVFDDPDSEQTGQYISFKDAQGNPCYGPWDAENPATDIGLRGANPRFEGMLNPTTVLHADSGAFYDYYHRQAPPEVLEALAAVVLFNNFIVKKVAIPYLEQIAEAFGRDPVAYVAKFYPEGRRARTLTRAILYHLNPPEGTRPVSKIDGAELLIKEHSDKSSFTIDSRQTSKGLQYFVDGIWRDARTEVACFRGTADDELTDTGKGSLTPPTVHRAIAREDLPSVVSPELAKKGLARIALPTFISLSTRGARVVQANSVETHPTA
jgi:hypothetical protein